MVIPLCRVLHDHSVSLYAIIDTFVSICKKNYGIHNVFEEVREWLVMGRYGRLWRHRGLPLIRL